MTRHWRDRAECRAYDPEKWFPVSDSGTRIHQVEEAKNICWLKCPVREACLQWAVEHKSLASHGIWGGLTERERGAWERRASRRAARAVGA